MPCVHAIADGIRIYPVAFRRLIGMNLPVPGISLLTLGYRPPEGVFDLLAFRRVHTPFFWALAQAADITVFAAASLKNALDDATKIYEAKTGDKVVVKYAASSTLALQIEEGLPADVFFSADLDWMDYLEQRKFIDPACGKVSRSKERAPNTF
jgi:hypothetical protein